MSKFIIDFINHNASALFEYDDDGHLLSYQLSPGTFSEDHFKFLIDKFPKSFALMQKWIEAKQVNPTGYQGVKIREVQPDLSFGAFYTAYNFRSGKRSRAEAVWEKMDDINRAKAIAYIPKYENNLLKTGWNKMMAETYLNRQEWNN